MRWIAVILVALLAACATVPTAQQETPTFFNDNLFAAPTQPVNADSVFALSDEMRSFIGREIGNSMHGVDRRRALFDALYNRKKLKLEYDSTLTRNAEQAFNERSGNCLSLVILTAAFAKHLDLPVQYQNVFSVQNVSRLNDTVYVSGHVNLVLMSQQTGSRLADTNLKPMTIDFLPPKDTAGQHSRVVSENTIVAMYMNNRAAETLAQGQMNDAYYWARGAINEDATFLNGYNTLGVVYFRHGNLREAERVLRYVVALQPEDPSPISNLIVVLDKMGMADESRQWSDKLKQIQQFPPFHYFDIGMQAMRDKDYTKAKEMFAKEVGRAPYYHEFHAWLAAADYQLGDIAEARKQLTLAIRDCTTASDRDVYTERLKTLNSPQSRMTRH